MSLRLYNTRTRALETFQPADPQSKRVSMYVCGLTPSAQTHVGHARTYLCFDVLRRYLQYLGYEVRHVQNVTDIDDRSIARGLQTGENWRTIVADFYASFKSSMQRLDVMEPGAEPRATDFISEIIAMIRPLLERGFAYAARDGVYYRVGRFAAYGALSGRNTDELLSGARVEVDEHKEDPLDFALWKFAKPGEPAWESPWGKGRPGWHIECSAMVHGLLGEPIDIHGGGADLIFPHHENEIAQSEPLFGQPLARFWIHGGVLLFDQRKMSKSLGNYEALSDLLERHDPQAVRLLFLQTGYRKVMNFNEDAISGAEASLERLKETWRALHAARKADSEAARQWSEHFVQTVCEALDDDLNTAAALAHLHTHVARNADFLQEGARSACDAYQKMLWVLGIEPKDEWLHEPKRALDGAALEPLRELAGASADGQPAEEVIARVIAMRERARAEKDFAASDRLREALARAGIEIHDTREGTTWSLAG